MRGQTGADNSKVRGWGSFPKLAEQTHNSQTHTSLDLDGGIKGIIRDEKRFHNALDHCNALCR